jgi:isopropylmalate/homocitrate/citramalate synthase
MTKIQLYDTTLRDGMQGEGMSLSAEEKVRVAHRLDQLGIDLIEAGFPSSNPKELELFALLADESFEHAEIAAFGMTRRRGARAEEDPALRPCMHARRQDLGTSPGEGGEGRPRGEPADDLRFGGLPRGGGQARRVRR